MIKSILLQCKFLLVEFLNVSYMILPNPFRRYYLRLFGIKIAEGSSIHRHCIFFHVGNLSRGVGGKLILAVILTIVVELKLEIMLE